MTPPIGTFCVGQQQIFILCLAFPHNAGYRPKQGTLIRLKYFTPLHTATTLNTTSSKHPEAFSYSAFNTPTPRLASQVGIYIFFRRIFQLPHPDCWVLAGCPLENPNASTPTTRAKTSEPPDLFLGVFCVGKVIHKLKQDANAIAYISL